MAIVDRFLGEARIGLGVDLVSGPKEIEGVIVSLDTEIVSVKKKDGKIANIDLSTISYYEISEMGAEEPNKVVQSKEPATFVSGDKVEESNSLVEEETVIKAEIADSKKKNNKYSNNEVEEAVVRHEMQTLSKLLNDKEHLSNIGYSDTLIDRIERIVSANSLAKGNDDYSIASRLDTVQGNLNHLAERYYISSLNKKETSETQKTKAARKIQHYYVQEKNYSDYLTAYAKYAKYLDLTKGYLYVFHAEALASLQEDKLSELYKIPVNFQNEVDFVILFNYLLEHPDNYIAGNATYNIIHDKKFVKASELALEYAFNNKETSSFEKLRVEVFLNLYPMYSLDELSGALSVGHAVSETEKIVLSENVPENEGDNNYEIQERSPEIVIGEYLEDNIFGLIRAIEYAKRHEYESYSIDEKIHEVEISIEDEWNQAIENNNDIRKQYLLVFYEIIGVSEEKILEFRRTLRNDDESELFKAIERYDAKKVEAIISDIERLKRNGYTEKEIEKLVKVFNNDAFPKGIADYEVASRLTTWGFLTQAVRYYINVANNPHAEKRKNAINQLLVYATQNKDVEMFEKYYALLDSKQKKNDVYIRFLNDCKYYHEEFKALYDIFLSDTTTVQPTVIYGALRYENNQKHRIELIDKACQLGTFDYEFWMAYLCEVAKGSVDVYRDIISKLLNEYASTVAWNLDKCFQLLLIDPDLNEPITTETVMNAMDNNSPLAIPLILNAKNTEGEAIRETILNFVISKLNYCIEEMDYKLANEVGKLTLRMYPENEELSDIVRIAGNGLDVYNMLPSGHDNYAKGKRLLMLGEDADRAFSCFEKEIGISEDKKVIALCGMELLKGLYEAQRFSEVIKWGQILIIEKDITEYSAMALDINNAFNMLNDETGKEKFLNELVDKANKAISENEYEDAVTLIKLIEIFDKNNTFVLQYGELLDKVKTDSINLDEDTFIGQANVLRYVDKDEKKYVEYLKTGFTSGTIEGNNKNTAATLLLEAILANDVAAENMDFVDNIKTYGITITEHIVDMLYTIVSSTKNIDDAIGFFSDLLDNVEADKRLPILIRLEKIYENALKNNCDFKADFAVNQMLEYTQKNSSLQARLCYVWLLAYTGMLDDAAELLALIPDDANYGEEQNSIIESIVEKFFDGNKPDLVSKFDLKIKEKTLYRFVEHCKIYRDFVSFSIDEEKIHAELIKNASYKVDVSSDIVKTAIIKTIYGNPTRYKFWYLYFLCVRNVADPALLYCLNTNLVILNTDVTNDTSEKQANFILKTNEEVSRRYVGYKLYNKLYRLYILKAYQKNISVVNQISSFSMDRKVFSANPEIRKTMAEDYIHLLKLLDDRDDYIYVKSAMFIATNNKCEEYFYSLFRNDLLYREPVICVKMCLEMLVSGKGTTQFCNKVLDELAEASPEHAGIVSVLKSNNSSPVCRLLKDYPAIPKEEHVSEIMSKYNDNLQTSIQILEAIDKCYSEAIIIKRRLLVLYRRSCNRNYYEKMYQIIICLIRGVTSEDALYGLCRMCALLAVALGKKNRTTDIINIYDKQSLDREYARQLMEFCDACESYDTNSDAGQALLFDALITDEWLKYYGEYGVAQLADNDKFKVIVGFAKMPFVQNAFKHMSILGEAKKDEELKKFQNDFDEIIQDVFGESIYDVIVQVSGMTVDKQREFISVMPFTGIDNPYKRIPNDEITVKTLLRLWDVVYGRETLINNLIENKTAAAGYDLLYRHAISYYENYELLANYTENLFDKKDYKKIISIKKEFDWASKDIVYATYFGVSLLLENDGIALDYVSRMTGELYVNLVLLLKKRMLNEEIQRICTYAPVKRGITNLINLIVDSPNAEQLAEIETDYNSENKIALIKLLYSRITDTDVKSLLYEKYGDSVVENNYITLWSKQSSETKQNYYFESDDSDENLNVDITLGSKCAFLDEAMKEVSLEEYASGIVKGERRRILNLYDGLGVDVSENAEYRKELLIKLIFISAEQSDQESYLDYLIKLGVVLYYSYSATNIVKARGVLFETIEHINKETKRNNVELVRKTVCELLSGFESVDEIIEAKNDTVKALSIMLKVSYAKEFSVFFQRMIETIEMISEVLVISDISQRASNYQKVLGKLKTLVARSSNSPLFGQVYTKWYRIIQTEIKKLSKGAVIDFEVETVQCSARGKICCVIQNMGKKPAENIIVRAIFEDAVRCKDNEKEIKILYGGDTSVFAFNIRCRDEGIQNYKIELSYEIGQNVEQLDYSEEIRIVREAEYEHIGNLYSVAPVTSNAEFYGREREKEEILSFLNDIKYNTSMVMHGLKRVGKTSMLRFIERTMRDSGIYIPVYKSAQGIGEQNAIGKMFVETIIDELENIGMVDDKCRSFIEYDYDKNPEQLYDFYTYLQKSEMLNGKRILFMADEIEEIFDMVDEGIINRRFYKVLRVILQELTSVRFIFCGADHLTDILYNHALADVFEITKRVIISRLDEESMQRMIVEPATDKLSYTDRAVERIWYYTKGHTFYSKHICSKVIDILNEESRATVYAYDVDLAVKQVMRVTEYFIYLSRFFSENDKQVIKLMCDNIKYSRDRVSLDLLEDTYEGRGLGDALTGLEFKDILEKTEGYDTDFYQFSIEMFRLWYSKAEYVTEAREDA